MGTLAIPMSARGGFDGRSCGARDRASDCRCHWPGAAPSTKPCPHPALLSLVHLLGRTRRRRFSPRCQICTGPVVHGSLLAVLPAALLYVVPQLIQLLLVQLQTALKPWCRGAAGACNGGRQARANLATAVCVELQHPEEKEMLGNIGVSSAGWAASNAGFD